jgi:hypothetical protein
VRVVPCYKCRQRIWFGETERGKIVPINTWTTKRGNIVAIDPDADRPMVRWLKKGEEPESGMKRYLSHITTCRVKKKK